MNRLTIREIYLKYFWPIKGEHVLISLLTLVIYLLLFIFRSMDNNMLTSWQWVFIGADPSKIFILLIFGVIIAYILSRVSIPERYTAPFLFLASFVAAVLFWGTPETIVDASRYFTQAKHLETYGIGYFLKEWGGSIAAWTDMPLIPLIYGLIFKFLGESRVYIQAFTTILFSSTVVLTYKIGKTLWNENVGFIGGLLLLGIPYMFTQVPLMLVDIPTMFFFTLAIFAFIKVFNGGGNGTIIVSSVAVCLTVLSKYSTWVMLSVLVVIFVVYFIKERGQGSETLERSRLFGSVRQHNILYRSAAVIIISAFLIGIVVFLKFEVIAQQLELLVSYQQPGLKRWGESFNSTFFFQIHPFITLAAAYSIYAAVKKRDLKYVIISWLVLLVFLLQIERIRYIIMVFPLFVLMASYGLQEIRNRDLRKFIALCAVSSSIIIAAYAYLPFLQNTSITNLKNAGEYLNSIGTEDIEVYTLLQKDFKEINPAVSVPILDLFTVNNIIYDYNHPLPPLEEIETSSLRFTWDYMNPEYYMSATGNLKKDRTIIIISESIDETLPEHIALRLKGHRLSKTFNISTGIFLYQTLVMVYQPIE